MPPPPPPRPAPLPAATDTVPPKGIHAADCTSRAAWRRLPASTDTRGYRAHWHPGGVVHRDGVTVGPGGGTPGTSGNLRLVGHDPLFGRRHSRSRHRPPWLPSPNGARARRPPAARTTGG